MVSGIDVVMYKPDAELIRLAKLAIEKKIEDVILKPGSAAQVMAELDNGPEGKHWLAELEKARYPWFYVSTGTGWYHHHISWNDDLDIPFDSLRMHIQSIKAGKEVGRPTKKLIEERGRLIDEYRELIETDEDRESFDQTLAISQRVFPYVGRSSVLCGALVSQPVLEQDQTGR